MKNIKLLAKKLLFNRLNIRKGRDLLMIILLLPIFPQIAIGQLVSSEIPHEKTETFLCTREVALKPDVDPKIFEKWVIEYWNPEWQGLIPGFECYIDKKKSYLGENTYIHCLKFTKRISEAIPSNTDDLTDWYREFIYYEPTKHLYDELFEYIELDQFIYNKSSFKVN